MTEVFANFAQSTLSAPISASQATITIATPAVGQEFPATGNFRIVVQSFDPTTLQAVSGREIMLVTAVSGNTFTVTRGAESTTAMAFASGATVAHIVTAQVMRDLQSSGSGITFTDGVHTVSSATQLSVTGATVGGTSPNATLTISASGTPGGSDTQVQYNNAGSFGGITGATTDGTTLTLVAPVLGTPASGVLTNCTGTASGLTAGAVSTISGLISAGSNITITGSGTSGSPYSIAASGGGSGANLTDAITQTGHGFSVGNVVYLNGSTYTLAKADTAADAEVVGIVSAVADANNFTLLTAGYITGLSGLTAGTVYFLSPSSAGALTATAPSTVGQISKPLLIADSTTSGYFNNWRGSVVSAASTNLAYRSISFTFDGGGSALTSGKVAYLATIPYAGTITAWDIVADQSGSAVIDVWKANAAVPTVANTITASAKPTISSAQSAFGGAITGWTTSVAAGDVFGAHLDSCSTVTSVTLTILITANT